MVTQAASATLALLLLGSLLHPATLAFSPVVVRPPRITTTKLPDNGHGLLLVRPAIGRDDDDQDGIGDAFTKDNDNDDLSKQFYKQLKSSTDTGANKSSSDEERPAAAPPKFTGGRQPSRLFSEEEQPPPAESSSSSGDNPYEREINLASAFENTLGIQALVLVAALTFVLSVGFTGGITDGSERYYGGADEIEQDLWNVPVPSQEEVGVTRVDRSVFL